MAKPAKMPVAPVVVNQIAGIIGLDASGTHAAELARQVQAIHNAIDAMDEVDLTDVEPATVFVIKQGQSD